MRRDMPNVCSGVQPSALRCLLGLAAFLFAIAACVRGGLFADEPASKNSRTNFASLLEAQTRATFDAVAAYVAAHPDAADIEQAYQWVFETALTRSMEAEALPFAEGYLKNAPEGANLRLAAQFVQCLGLARQGKLDDAMAVFDEQVRGVRLRGSNATIDLARSLATRAQMAGDLAVAREVFEKLSGAFFLNADVKEMCQNKIDKLDLIGRPAPAVGVAALSGQTFNLGDFGGKVVLVDFWATNCLPCLEEFPKMKRLYSDYHDKGFEIVGISLDDDREIVDQFQQQARLPWPLIVNPTEIGPLRERYHVRKIPSTYLVDQMGRMHRVDIAGADLRTAVESLLNAGK